MTERQETGTAGGTARPLTTTTLCALAQGIGGGLGWSVLPPLLPSIAADLHVSRAMGGLAWGAAPLGIALAAPLGGAAVDRWGGRRVAGLALLAGALTCAGRSLAAGPWGLVLAMFLFGLHIGFVAPAIPKVLAGHVPAARLGRANGIALLAYTLGTAITVLVAGTVLAPALGGWRPLMVAAGGAIALVGIAWLLLVRDRATSSHRASLRSVLALAAEPQLRRVAMLQFLLFGGYLALLGLLPRALAGGGMAPGRVGLAVSAWLVVAAAANLAGPWISDRVGRRRPFLLGGGAIAATALAFLAITPARGTVPLLAIAAIGGGCVAPLLLVLPLEMPGIGVARAGAALGLLMLVGQIGGFLVPVLAGAIAVHGFGVALGFLAVVHLALVLPALGLSETAAASAPSSGDRTVEKTPARLVA